MRIIKKTGWVLLIVIVIAQFFGPEKNHGDINDLNAFFEDTNPPEAVTLILKESCFDCHSSFTRYPWYNNITPVNYWISSHIDHGRSHLNFSNWTGYNIKNTWMHSQANLTDAQIRSVLGWAKFVRSGYSVESKPE
jgi:hypothetical protein